MSLDFGRIDTILKIKPSSDTLGRLTALKDGRTGTLIDGSTGNRLSAKVGTVRQIYSYPTDSHCLSAVAGVARTYDANSNTTAIGGTARQYTYDTTGRMTQARRAGAVTMNYRYNGRGEQVRRFLGTTNTYTLYDEAGHWLGDYDSNGAPKQQAIWLDDLPVGLLANANNLHYIEPDHLGSPRVVIDPTRDVAVWTWSLKGEAFGNTAPNQDPDGDGAALVLDMRFPGQRFDAASGLNQNYFPDYEAATGRYGQSDPIGFHGGIGTYAYGRSSPFLWPDKLGLLPGDCYRTENLAAAQALKDILPASIKEDLEYGGWVYQKPNGYYSYTAPRRGTTSSVNPGPRPDGATGAYHTHGDVTPGYVGEAFSKADTRIPYGDAAYLGTPSGKLLRFSTSGSPYSELPGAIPSYGCGCDGNNNKLLEFLSNAFGWQL
ncbi:DUF4329 domain-containing protein [Xanthomonas citri pv. phaseoli var. fuscans]|nr:DUF4329 domain-containing protein [Xanthomonas citri pv. phaseoli var. fuscans]ATS41817.1 DUF4329 domain-containing protein [Xanthomonas citri pv. phaseoli var. fuscans]ATS47380.1 DUF4329 domain-containing protein [Xanthomonas citri pv. phaseoli var. fuscans]ATS86242.1 DUF4329 domain-containing protein [Xanthomonas citri pv. phaseoli var. fuscans]QWN21015.1 DUF4329 domain-containing protein [Xanthomonas citri]